MICWAFTSQLLQNGRTRQLHFATRERALAALMNLQAAGFICSDLFETICSLDLLLPTPSEV